MHRTHHKVSEQWFSFLHYTWNILHSCGNNIEGMKRNTEWHKIKRFTWRKKTDENTQFTQQSWLHLINNALVQDF